MRDFITSDEFKGFLIVTAVQAALILTLAGTIALTLNALCA